MRTISIGWAVLIMALASFHAPALAGVLDRQGIQFGPFLEWDFPNPTPDGNPYDVIATATFTHADSGQTITTEMFYAGGDTWCFRFTGTEAGVWRFTTSSPDPDLNGAAGTVTLAPSAGGHGFLKQFGDKWGWQGTETAFVPQLVMVRTPTTYYHQRSLIDDDIATFIDRHGFNGFHTSVGCRWFDMDAENYDGIDTPDPDPRTFEALESLITKVHAAGGMVHLWVWGDEQRHQTPVKWGINGAVDQRLQRYIAARLGPLPGWTMGYGFDLDEWVTVPQIKVWHDTMHSKLGWHHFLGGRPGGPNRGKDHSAYVRWNEVLDYSSYEHHQPDYDVYVAALQAVPGHPCFSEDRFRIRDSSIYRDKDYDMERTRRGLWHSAMAGGVANIWGYLHNSPGDGASGPYPKPEWIKTHAVFFGTRFLPDMVRDNGITDGVCLRSAAGNAYIVYKENADSIRLDLSAMRETQPAIAVDARKPYAEIRIGPFAASDRTWRAPYRSDWAVAVGAFGGVAATNKP